MSKLGEICKISSSKRIFENEYQESGVPFIRGQEISDGSLLSNSCFNCYIAKERFNEIKNKYGVPKKGDILITAVGTIGNVCFLNKDIDFYFKDGNVLWIKNFSDNVVPEYLYFYLKSPFFKKTIGHSLIGAVQKALTMQMLSEIDIQLPPIEYQKSVVTILKSIEDKISNNNKINAELESLAKTIYDYWFLQFEFPNEEGKPYKSSGGKMVWNEELKREIPEGWSVKSINDAEIYVSDYTANGSFAGLAENVKYNEGDKYALLIRPVDFNSNFDKKESFIYVNKHGYDYLSKSNLYGDELILCNVGAVGSVYRCPRFDFPMTLGPNGIVVNKENLNHYLFNYFRSSIGQQQIIGISSGSIQMKFNKTNFRALNIPFPNTFVLNLFNKKYSQIYNTQQTLWKENKILSSLRDFLLPMLMNGQITFR